MKEWKNRTIDIFGSKWSIKFIPRIFHLDEDNPVSLVKGASYHDKNIIKVALADFEGVRFKDEEIFLTLLHELVHAVFGEGQYMESCQDEPLVEWTAKCIRSLIKQKVLVWNT